MRKSLILSLMTKSLWVTTLLVGCAAAQTATPAKPDDSGTQSGAQQAAASADDLAPTRELRGKTGLVRGVLKRLDPIHDQLLVHTFGGGDIRIGFDGRTQLVAENQQTRLTSLPVGSVLSVDTVMDNGKLFARSVRTGTAGAVDLSGQVVRFDYGKSELILHDPMSPQNISVRVTSSTTVTNQGQPASAAALLPGTLVMIKFSAAQKTASEVKILAERGGSFTFQGRIVSVDLRSRVVALSNDTDQSLRELSFNTLDTNSVNLLREGAEVNIQAEFDGDHYNIRSVAPVPHNP
jgi:hypothetical protein